MPALDESTLIFNRQGGRFSSNGNDDTLEDFEKAEAESAGLGVLLHLSCSPGVHLRCCCPFLLQVSCSADVGNTDALECLVTASPRKKLKFMEISRKKQYSSHIFLHKGFEASEPHQSAINKGIPDNVILKGKKI